VFISPGNVDGTPALQFASTNRGDYNHNGIVDAADYVIWRKGLGTTYTLADYEVWRSHFGETVSIGSTTLSSVTVPEFSGAWRVLIGVAMMAAYLRRPTYA
jgi:hypothetical protein